MIPAQQIVIVPEEYHVQKADDGNIMVAGKDTATGLIVALVFGPQAAKDVGTQLSNSSGLTVVRHRLDSLPDLPPPPKPPE